MIVSENILFWFNLVVFISICFFFPPDKGILTFQAGTTKNGTEGKPCGLKKLETLADEG